MLRTFRNAWKVEELRKKLLFTLLIIVLYRIGAAVHVPFTDFEAIQANLDMSGGNIFTYLNILSGQAFSQATLFALGVSPYITASIVIQLLTVAIPIFEKWQKSGESGQKKLTALTRIVTVALAFVTAWGYYMYMRSYSLLTEFGDSVFGGFVIVFCYAAGASLVMWLAEKINEHGIGNGISMILFANIVASGVSTVTSLVGFALTDAWYLVLTVAVMYGALAMLTFVVWVTNSERRIPVQYAKRTVGNKMMGGQSTHLPIKLNMSGVMPIIFANSIVALPGTFELIFSSKIKEGGFWDKFFEVTGYTSPLYAILFFVLIIAFSYFYIMISFNPTEVANTLKKNGGTIRGIRAGEHTAAYIQKILNKITLIGAIFLGIVAVVPLLVNMIAGGIAIGSLAFGGSSLLIVVGVILETIREIEAQLSMRHHKGFID
ncbi:MAG: preprotein translocase subunit SecY [Clostridia bacterium]|nr:preprotein translocase subunit SecY [Clostridia bacterium]